MNKSLSNPFEIDSAALRKLMREERFCTPLAMEILGLREPTATETLIRLARAGWVRYLGQEAGMDQWEADRNGINFSMEKLIARTSAKEGDKILLRAVAAARIFNAEKRSSAVTRITLFGSLARGGDESQTVGDVDLQIEVTPREHLGVEIYGKLLEADKDGCPYTWDYCWRANSWALARGVRAVRATSTRISASLHDNIGDMGCEHRIAYAYDAGLEVELPVDGKMVPADVEKQREFNAQPAIGDMPEIPAVRPLPAYPSPGPGQSEQIADGDVAEYAWMQGRSLEDIAKWMGRSVQAVQAALSIRADKMKDPMAAALHPSPLTTMAAFLERHADTTFNVSMRNKRKGASRYRRRSTDARAAGAEEDATSVRKAIPSWQRSPPMRRSSRPAGAIDSRDSYPRCRSTSTSPSSRAKCRARRQMVTPALFQGRQR